MKVTKLFFDMDGVLADFDRGVSELLGLQPKDQEVQDPEAEERLFAAVRAHRDFYAHLEPIPGMLELFKELKQQYDCEILTGIPRPERGILEARDNKVAWVEQYLGKDIRVHTVLRKEKPLYAADKSHILIDDHSGNIRQWEQAGGTGILFEGVDKLRKTLASMGL